MQFKDLRLGVKLALGFGALIAITGALGILSFFSMRSGYIGSKKLANMYLPEVKVGMDMQRSALQTLMASRSFILSEDAKYGEEGRQQLEELRKHLDVAQKLAEENPELVKLQKSVLLVRSQLDDFAGMAAQTEDGVKSLNQSRAKMDEAAGKFVLFAMEYLESQNTEMLEQIMANRSLSELAMQQGKINKIYGIIRLGNIIWIKSYRAQVTRNTDLMEEGLAIFKKIAEEIAFLRTLNSHAEESKKLDAIKVEVDAFEQGMQACLANWGGLKTLSEVSQSSAEEVVTASVAAAAAGMDQTQEVADSSTDRLGLSSWVVLGGLGLAVLVGVLISLFLTRAITRPIIRGSQFAAEVAGGDLSRSLDIAQKDEVGQLASAMNTMVTSLRAKIGEAEEQRRQAQAATEEAQSAMDEARRQEEKVSSMLATMQRVSSQAAGIAERVSSASEELAAQVEQVSNGAEQQRDQMHETATSMEEMNGTVLEVARNASEAASNSGNAREEAERGEAIVRDAVRAIDDVHQAADQLQENMRQLGKQAEAIGQVMNVISDIADQTNLLALNAAIEAARAGDAGRGFAVVADEVRKLAEKTMSATQEVGSNIRAIQEAARKNMQSMESAAMSVEKATRLANESGEALGRIVGLVTDSAHQVEGIAAATTQISQAIEEVNRLVSETAEGMVQSSQAVQELANMSSELRALMAELIESDKAA